MTDALVLLLSGRSLSKCLTVPALASVLLASAWPSAAQEIPRAPSSEAGQGWVAIGLDEYKTLRAKAYPPEREPEPPPVEATLSRVEYDLHVNGEFASGRATLTIDVLKDGWVRVPIPASLLVREAKLDGKPVSLVSGPAAGKSGSQLAAVLSRPGRATLVLDIALPIAANAGEESIVLPPSFSGVTRATLELPRQGVDIRLTGGLLSDRSETPKAIRWIVYATGPSPLAFSWKRKTEDRRAELPLRLRGSLTQLLGLGEDSAPLSAEVNLEIVQGVASEVKLEVPPQVTINQVLGAGVADWESKSGELRVTFLEPVQQSARFVITGETRLPRDGNIEIPLLQLLHAERTSGGAAVEVLGAGEIKEVKMQGFENADASDLGELIANRQSPSLAAFRLRGGDASQPRTLAVNVARYDQQALLLANVEEARYRVLLSKEGKTLVQARYAVRNNQRTFVKIMLPPGATLWSAALSGQPVRPGQAPDGGLLLPLEKSKATPGSADDPPEFAVEIVYFTPGTAWNDKGKARIALPALDLPVSRTGLQVYYPPLFRVASEPGIFHTETYADPFSPVLSTNRSLAASGSGLGGSLDRAGKLQAGVGAGMPSPAPTPANASTLAISGRDTTSQAVSADTMKALVDKYRSSSAVGRATGVLPLSLNFTAFGPSVYLVSELTSENQSASAELSFQQDKKRGVR
ncbi:MAG TPA: hypothetical protein VKB24_07035 [Candidatus Acidoferrum sp.]|nr:hypothetical protein [Candidatus Acidoferrum sp.]